MSIEERLWKMEQRILTLETRNQETNYKGVQQKFEKAGVNPITCHFCPAKIIRNQTDTGWNNVSDGKPHVCPGLQNK